MVNTSRALDVASPKGRPVISAPTNVAPALKAAVARLTTLPANDDVAPNAIAVAWVALPVNELDEVNEVTADCTALLCQTELAAMEIVPKTPVPPLNVAVAAAVKLTFTCWSTL